MAIGYENPGFLRVRSLRNYRDKEAVFSQGDTADAIFYIQSGTVKLTAVSTRRKKAI
ncbi:MAG: cyclic nucleotide-binding domain-containing protein, partial [Candidatus Sulfotelmatobacter sp.]